ncbi:MAG: hypothetical protein LBS53_04945 [Synergistaceae bacterium]|nr:hypothetical protein [Synergistaceae bacterium]
MAAANSIVRNCYSSAAVSATNGDVGGVVGYMVGNAAGVLVENCYSSGYVSGSTKDTFCQGSFLLK